MKNILLINGKKRSGKDTSAKIIKEELINQGKSVKILSFADTLKDMVCEMFNISRADLEYLKNNTNCYEHSIVSPSGIGMLELPNFRTFLDCFGNSIAKRLGGDSVWADIILKQVLETDYEYYIIPDFRFPIEIDVFNLAHVFGKSLFQLNVTTLQVQRNGLPHSDLISENSLNDFTFDYIIDNNSDLENIKKQVVTILADININKKDK